MAEVIGKAEVQSLADYVLSLSAGSRCFCCGKPLQPEEGNGSAEAPSACLQRMTCSQCGSEVADVLRRPSAQTQERVMFVGARRTAA